MEENRVVRSKISQETFKANCKSISMAWKDCCCRNESTDERLSKYDLSKQVWERLICAIENMVSTDKKEEYDLWDMLKVLKFIEADRVVDRILFYQYSENEQIFYRRAWDLVYTFLSGLLSPMISHEYAIMKKLESALHIERFDAASGDRKRNQRAIGMTDIFQHSLREEMKCFQYGHVCVNDFFYAAVTYIYNIEETEKFLAGREREKDDSAWHPFKGQWQKKLSECEWNEALLDELDPEGVEDSIDTTHKFSYEYKKLRYTDKKKHQYRESPVLLNKLQIKNAWKKCKIAGALGNEQDNLSLVEMIIDIIVPKSEAIARDLHTKNIEGIVNLFETIGADEIVKAITECKQMCADEPRLDDMKNTMVEIATLFLRSLTEPLLQRQWNLVKEVGKTVAGEENVDAGFDLYKQTILPKEATDLIIDCTENQCEDNVESIIATAVELIEICNCLNDIVLSYLAE